MKKQIFKYILVAGFGTFMIAGAGCKKIDKFGDTNWDPNTTPEPAPSALLTNVETALGNLIYDGNFFRNTATQAFYCQYLTQSQYTEEVRYAIPDYNWDMYFAGSDRTDIGRLPGANIGDLQTIIDFVSNPANKAKAEVFGSINNQLAVARILRAYLYWNLTDQYGDMPYKEALKNKDAVPYTEQKDIYPDLLKELKEAVAQFDNGAMPKGDILYKQSKAAWVKFANSVRLLVALRLSKIAPDVARTEITSALTAGVIEANADNAKLVYPGSAPYLNPFNEYYDIVQRDDIAVTDVVTGILSGTNDPRLGVYGSSDVGFPYGLTRAEAVGFADEHADYARPFAEKYRTGASPMYLITAAHVWLARAEIANLGWGGDAATAYRNGIQASWEQWGVFDQAAFDAFMASPNIALTTEAPRKIATQQWLSFFPDGRQGWAIWRKTGFPVLTPAPGTNLQIPRRIPFGSNERNLNTNFYNQAAARYTVNGVVNSYYGRVWWDKQ